MRQEVPIYGQETAATMRGGQTVLPPSVLSEAPAPEQEY